jgi:type II secretory pathway component PulF
MESELFQLNYAGAGGIRKQYALTRRRHPVVEFFLVSSSTLLWAFAALFTAGIGIGWIFIFSGFLLGFQAMFVAVILFPMLAAAAGQARRRRATAALGYLHQAMRLNQPINRVLGAAVISERGRLARQLGELRMELEAGSRLSVALGWTFPEMPPRAIALIEHAEQSAQLPQTLHRLIDEERGEFKPASEKKAFALWYPPSQLMVISICILFIVFFVVPKFVQIFQDFRVPLPALLRLLSGWDSELIAIAPVMAIIILVGCGIQLRKAVSLRRPTRILAPIVDRMAWYTPFIGSLQQDRALADVCTVVADSMDQGHSLETSLTRASQLEMNVKFEQRLTRWLEALAAGSPAPDAARSAGMPALLVGLLTTGQSTPNAAETLRFAARFYRDRFSARRAVLAELAVPAMTILIGLVVALIALSIFQSMRQLIDSISVFPGGM